MGGVLSPARLTRMRRRFASLLPDVATVQRAVVTADGGGGQTEAWTVLAEAVPCRLSPVGGGETKRGSARGGDRIADEAISIVTFAAGTDITEADRVVIAGDTFDVTLVRLRGEWELTRRCEVREVGP